ncbi:MAG: hypothetical protein IKJ55_01770 [Clostridia bacterium]|nr:hypothetical protein [Clostridia bacterium]
MQEKSMKWYNFLVYVGIWVLVALFILAGVFSIATNVPPTHYEDATEAYYASQDGAMVEGLVSYYGEWHKELINYNIFTTFEPNYIPTFFVCLIGILFGLASIACGVFLIINRSGMVQRIERATDKFRTIMLLHSIASIFYWVFTYDATLSVMDIKGMIAFGVMFILALFDFLMFWFHGKYFKNRSMMLS